MQKTCLKCGFENPEASPSALADCPKCGAIYSRVEEHLQRQAAARAAEEKVRVEEAAAKAETDRRRAESRDAYAKNTAEAQRKKLLGAAYASPNVGSPAIKGPAIVKTYKGTHANATASFQAEAQRMAAEGYVPTSQEWAPGSYGCGAFLVALLLCFLVIGIVVFIYMLLVKPPGTLSVTYELRPTNEPVRQPHEEKTCPRCAEQVKAAANVCRYCGHNFEQS